MIARWDVNSHLAFKSMAGRVPEFSVSVDWGNEPQSAEPSRPTSETSQPEQVETTSPMERHDREGMTLRRWESAQTTRLNKDQWCGVQSRPINADLQADRPTLVARSRYERRNNPIVEGVVDSFALDVVGENGPNLIVESEDEVYNETFKAIWQRVWDTLEVSGMNGTDLLTRLVGQEWDNGDWLQQIVTDEKYSGEAVSARLLDIDPERMSTDPRFIGQRNVVLGVERDDFGRPTFYHIRSPKDQFSNHFFGELSYNWKRIEAEDILHSFVSREPGQARGFPSLASCLQEMADLRDYDYQTLDAARFAANNGGVMWTTEATIVDSEVEKTGGETPNSINFERQTIKKIPAGYQFSQMMPNNPTAQYIDFRHEKLRSLGRVKHMPLLMVLLSAEDSNFSQSRIDLNVIYERGLRAYRRWIERNWLMKLIELVKREAMLAFRPGSTSRDADPFVLPREPKGCKYSFGWEPIGQANPKDHVIVQQAKLAMGLTTPEWEHAKQGTSEDAALDSIARTNDKRTKRGLDPLKLGNPKQQKPGTDDQENDGKEANEQQSKKKKAKAKSSQQVAA